jgi:type VI secretion system protein ImpK
MNQNDPFDLHADDGRTVIVPKPGGRGPSGPAVRRAVGPSLGPTAATIPTVGHNPLVAGAVGILSLAPRLRTASPPAEVEQLRERLIAELRQFEARAEAEGVDHRTVQIAAWALCALIDDVILNTPWGRHSVWPAQGLVATLFHEVDAGERFFERLTELERDAARHRDLLELMYLCLTLGFEGRFRVQRGTGHGLADVRDNLYRLVRQLTPEPETELSPHWRGVVAPLERDRFKLPYWVIGVGTLATLLLVYAGFNFRLAAYTEQVGPLLQTLPPQTEVSIDRESAVTSGPAASPRLAYSIVEKIETALPEAVADGRLVASEDAQRVTVRLHGGVFGSGKAAVSAEYLPILEQVGATLSEEPGQVLVVGHTDSSPIRTPRFPSNWELSQARAQAVAEVLAGQLGGPGRLATDGRADTEPMAPNDTAEGRDMNRRIEIILVKES